MSRDVVAEYMPLREGEEKLGEIQGDAYNMSPDIFSRIFGFIIRIVSIILGISKKIHLIVTDNRVIVVEINKVLWFIDGSVESMSFTPRSINSVGYKLARSLIVFKSHYLTFASSGTGGYLIKAKSGQPKVMEMIGLVTNLAEKVKS